MRYEGRRSGPSSKMVKRRSQNREGCPIAEEARRNHEITTPSYTILTTTTQDLIVRVYHPTIPANSRASSATCISALTRFRRSRRRRQPFHVRHTGGQQATHTTNAQLGRRLNHMPKMAGKKSGRAQLREEGWYTLYRAPEQ
jgi:hypothetical protein